MRGQACFLVGLIACGAPARAPAPVRTPPPPAPAGTAPAEVENRRTRWSNITTVDNCFYFSGPFNGREQQLHGLAELAVTDGRATLRLATAEFDGTLDGEVLSVSRQMAGQHEGSWTVTETITGTYRDGELRGQYRYEECGPNEPCPGRCTMTADLIAIVGPQ